MKNNKKLAIAGVSALSLAAIGFGAFAFFSDSSEQNTDATVGTVDVEGGNLDLSNKGNINPGDEDPENPYDPEDPKKTTPHLLSFDVSNVGTKSMVTRNIIDITVDKDTTNLDPTAFALYEKDATGKNKDLADIEGITVQKFTYEKDGKTVLRYIVEGASLNGEAGKLEDKDIAVSDIVRDSVKVQTGLEGVTGEDGVTYPTGVTYNYYLGMRADTLDEYQGASVKIDLEVQAMQYRNTNSDAWETVLKDTIVTGNEVVKTPEFSN